jgi:putative spermidine/putrescine transport system substrate-binding protein
MALAFAVVACTTTATPGSGRSVGPADDPSLERLTADARTEGSLTTIGLPRGWCGYGALIDGFKETYGLEVTELDPGAISSDQLEVLRDAGAGNDAQSPDVVDLGLLHAPPVRDEGLAAPYRVAGWSSIPVEAKDSDGHWWGAYYGVIAFEVNTDEVETVPRAWSDLLRPEYEGLVSLAGDPHDSSQAVAAVYAAALAAGGGPDDPTIGLDFFRRLADAGTLSSRIATTKSILDGRTPIALRWTYHALADRASTAKRGPDIAVVIPSSGRLAVPFVQAINATARHPSAARLWQEHLLSDDGQAGLLAGGCYPTRLADMRRRDVIADDALAAVPDPTGAIFPTAPQLEAATQAIDSGWEKAVGVAIR